MVDTHSVFLLFQLSIIFQAIIYSFAAFPGFQVRDLERNDPCFSYDVSGWTATRKRTSQIYTKCGSTYLLGGYGVLGTSSTQDGDSYSITYSGLSSHTMVYFSFAMWAIDSWNKNDDYFIVEVGSTSFTSWNNFDRDDFTTDYCGDNNDDLKDIKIFGRVLHTGSSLTFTLTSKMNQDTDNEAFGIRDLTLILASPSPLNTEMMCGSASIAIDPPNECACAPGLYLDASSVCSPCDSKCDSCFGPGPNECYACKQGYSFDGTNCVACDSSCASCFGLSNSECESCQPGYILYQNTTCIPTSSCISPMVKTGCNTYCDPPCSDPNDFSYWNNSCLSTCPSPLIQSTILTSVKICSFPCATGQYLYWNNSCLGSCPSPLSTRTEGGKNYCDYPCSISEFLYWNGTCASTCPAPLTNQITGGYQFCYYPCAPGQYLYWNSSCLTSCNSPLVQRTEAGKKYCDYPCLISEFLYWNGTCASTCSSPLVKGITTGRQYCYYPCLGAAFLYWDGSCVSTCASPLVQSTVAGKKYCEYPCSTSQFLYWNGTCSTACDLPLVQSSRYGMGFCNYPCNSSEFLYLNGSCLAHCLAPFYPKIEAGKKYCNPLCSNSFELLSNGSCISSCNFPLYFSTNASGTYCNLPCKNVLEYYHDATGVCTSQCNTSFIYQDNLYLRCLPPIETVPLVKLLHHIRYLDIVFPYKLKNMTVVRQMNVLSMMVIPSTIEEGRSKVMASAGILLEVANYDLPSSFIANLLEDIILMLIILGSWMLFTILEQACKNSNCLKAQILFERLKVLALNVLLILIVADGGDIIFFTSIEFKTFTATSITANMSLIINIVLLLAVVLTLLQSLYIVYKIQEYKARPEKYGTTSSYSEYLNTWESFQVIYRGFKETSLLTHSFYFIYGLRISAPMMIATFLSMLPILQSILYVIISTVTIAFIIHQRPIKNTVDLVNLIALEVFVLVANIGALVLTIFDLQGIEMSDSHIVLGDMIIVMNYCIYFLALVFLPVKIIKGIQYAASLRRDRSNDESRAWIQLLFLPLQQGGLGFEQVELLPAGAASKIKDLKKSRYNVASSQVLPQPLPDLQNSQVISEKEQRITRQDPEEDRKLDISNISNNLQVTNTDVSQTPRRKKRKQNFLRSQDDVNVIQKDNNDDDTLANRLRNLSNRAPETYRIDLGASKIEALQISRNFDISTSLNLSQLSPFNVNLDTSRKKL